MAVHHFTAPEGAALSVLDALLGLSRVDTTRGLNEWTSVRPELATVAMRHIAVACVRYMVREGGYRERALLRDGRRASGRIWDGAQSLNFSPRFTRATYDFWVGAARAIPALSAALRDTSGPESEGKRKHRRMVRDLVSIDGTRSGDWLFFALVRQNLGQFVLDAEDRSTLEKRLRRASPLVTAMDLEGLEETEPAIAERLSALMVGPDARIVECLDRTLEAAWTARADEAYAMRANAELISARWRTHAKVLRAYVSAADAAGRSDLLRPVLRFLVTLTTRTLREGGAALRTRAAQLPGVRSLAVRDEVVNAMADLVYVSTQVQRLRDVLAMERYGDDRYEEAQVFLRMYADEYAPSRAAVETLYRGLTGAVG